MSPFIHCGPSIVSEIARKMILALCRSGASLSQKLSPQMVVLIASLQTDGTLTRPLFTAARMSSDSAKILRFWYQVP